METGTVTMPEQQIGALNGVDIPAACDYDIDIILNEISSKLAYDDIQKDAVVTMCKTIETVSKSVKAGLYEMFTPAEEFYNMLLTVVPKDKIIQHRIGLDYTTKTPATLTVISHEYEDKLEEIMNMSADLDLRIFQESGNARFFWVITDHKLDQRLIDHDFPLYYTEGE